MTRLTVQFYDLLLEINPHSFKLASVEGKLNLLPNIEPSGQNSMIGRTLGGHQTDNESRQLA